MLSKRPRPIIGKISELLISGRGSSEFATSPRSPLDLVKMQSPRGLKSYGAGGIGLGIVAALEKSSEPKYTICSQSLARSNPVPAKTRRGFVEVDPDEEGFEDYTVVTCRGPDRSFTKVYHGGVVEYGSGYETETMIGKKGVESEERDLYPSSSYLSSCHMCRKNLDGQDIYMYRGEKASVESDFDGREEGEVQIGGVEVCGCFELSLHERPDILDRYCCGLVLWIWWFCEF